MSSEYPAGTLRVVIGDISGHGVDAALLMTTARAFIRMRATQPGEPAQVVTLTNRDLALDMGDSGSFMRQISAISPKFGTRSLFGDT